MPRSKKTETTVQEETQAVLPDKTPISEMTVRDFYAGICMAMLLQNVYTQEEEERPNVGSIVEKSFEIADYAVEYRTFTPLDFN